MKRRLLTLGAAALLALPAAASAQGFGIAARAGTLGFGGEAAVGLGPMLALRGGIGLMPLEVDATGFWKDIGSNVKAKLKLPKSWYNVGADLMLGGGFRIGGGMLFKPDDPSITGTVTSTGSIVINGTTYTGTDVAEVVGSIDSKDQAPYVLIGFGNEVRSGVGLFMDFGVAFMGDAPVTLTATKGALINDPTFKQQLEAERAKLENDLPTWAKKYWPILNVGLKVGLGG